jgi:hypothetical protein
MTGQDGVIGLRAGADKEADCKRCRFWSGLIAKWDGESDQMTAVCLGSGARRGEYTKGGETCDAWKENLYGEVDMPPNYGEEPKRGSCMEQGGISDRLSNFDDWGDRIRDRS